MGNTIFNRKVAVSLQEKLFPNIKRFTTIFTIAILSITLIILTLRLTVFSDMAGNNATLGQSNLSSENGPSATPEDFNVNSKIYFSSPDAAGTVDIENPATSDRDIRVKITRNDTNRTIYVSGALRPGSNIKTAKLQGVSLTEGVYPCTAEISIYEVGGTQMLESSEIPVTIYIGEEYANS